MRTLTTEEGRRLFAAFPLRVLLVAETFYQTGWDPQGLLSFVGGIQYPIRRRSMVKAVRVLAVLVALTAMSGCAVPPGTPTFTVSGTLSLSGVPYTITTAVITVTQGSNSYTTTVTLNAASVAYSVSGIPSGTYDVTAVLTLSNNIYPTISATATLNSSPVTASVSGSNPTWTITISALAISGDSVLDATLSGTLG
jgi:hypothetical protein